MATDISTGRRTDSGWVAGIFDDEYCDAILFQAKVFDEPSVFGMPTPRFPEGGNVSKLHAWWIDDYGSKHNLFCYDRGLDYIDPENEEAAEGIAEAIVLELELRYCVK